MDFLKDSKEGSSEPEKPQKGYLAFIIIVLCLGLGLTVAMSILFKTTSDKLKTYIVTTGTVIDYDVSTRRDEEWHTIHLFAEIAQFEADGETFTVTNSISSSAGVKKIGESVKIAYNPENPNDCIFLTSNNNAGLIVAIVLGVGFTIAALAMLAGYIIQYQAYKNRQNNSV